MRSSLCLSYHLLGCIVVCCIMSTCTLFDASHDQPMNSKYTYFVRLHPHLSSPINVCSLLAVKQHFHKERRQWNAWPKPSWMSPGWFCYHALSRNTKSLRWMCLHLINRKKVWATTDVSRIYLFEHELIRTLNFIRPKARTSVSSKLSALDGTNILLKRSWSLCISSSTLTIGL